MAFLIAILSQRTHYIAQFLPNLLQLLWGNQQHILDFPDAKFLEAFSFFFFTLSLFPFSRLKKSAEVTTHNGQACVIDQMPPTPRPVDKSAFVHCILGGTPWACPNPAGECSANFFPTLSQGSGFGPGPSCVNPRPDKTQHKRKGECSPKEPLC